MLDKNKLTQSAAAWFVISVMIFVSDITKNNEVIFPEIAALAVGMLLAPHKPWKTDNVRTVIYITVCAVSGLMISCFIHAPVMLKLIIAYIIGQTILLCSKTTLTPMISAIMLPVLLNTTSIIYPVSAFILTLLIVILKKVLCGFKISDDTEYKKENLINCKETFIAALRTLFMIAMVYFALHFNIKLCIAPPLIVAFTEFTRNKSLTVSLQLKRIAVITICAVIGAMCRYVFSIRLEMILTVSAMLAAVVMIVFLIIIKTYIPPAGAMTVLAFLIKEDFVLLYPIQVFIGISIFAFAAVSISKLSHTMFNK